MKPFYLAQLYPGPRQNKEKKSRQDMSGKIVQARLTFILWYAYDLLTHIVQSHELQRDNTTAGYR